MTNDQQLANNLIQRQFDVIRVEIGLQNDMLELLEHLQQDIKTQLAGVDLVRLNKSQLNALIKVVEIAVDGCYDAYVDKTKQLVSDLATDEASYLPSVLDDATEDDDVVESLSDGQINRQTANVLLGGLTISEAYAAQKSAIFNAIKQQIRTGAIDGTLPDLAGVFKKARNWIKSTVPTVTSAIRNQVTYAFGKMNKKVKAWRHVSVMDGHTSAMCVERNGLLWDKDKHPINHKLAFKVPPLHTRCRSILVMVTDLLAEYDGVSAQSWVESRTLSQLQEQFGKEIGRMLKSGQINIDDLVKNSGLQPMTLTELKQKYL